MRNILEGVKRALRGSYVEAKQVIVVRTDLKLGAGKLAAQVAHASLGAYRKALTAAPDMVAEWESGGEKKVVLKVSSERELVHLFQAAKGTIPAVLIKDAGLTQVPPGTITALGLGPASSAELDKLTGHLKLL